MVEDISDSFSIVVLIAWIYYSAQIFFLGAEITHVHTRRKRGDPKPVEYAVEAAPQTTS